MTSSHHEPLRVGSYHVLMGIYKEKRPREQRSGPHKVCRSPDWSLQLDSMKSGIASNRGSECFTVNTFPGLVHTARHTMGVGCKKK